MNPDFNKQFEPMEIKVKAPAWWVSNRYESAANAGRSVADAALQAIPLKTATRGKRCFDSPPVMRPQTEGMKIPGKPHYLQRLSFS